MRQLYDEKLAQAAYLIGCPAAKAAIVIDPPRDVDRVIDLAAQNDLNVTHVAETHVHADFVSGARELAERTGARVLVSGAGGERWTPKWLAHRADGRPYDHALLKDGDTIAIGGVTIRALHTPGHTPEHMSYLVLDTGAGHDDPVAIVTGDFLFVGDLGRPDLLESAVGEAGSMRPAAEQLHASLDAIRPLPDFAQVWPGHGAGSACGKGMGGLPVSTIGFERRHNGTIDRAADRNGFVDFILEGQPEPPLYFERMKRVNVEGPPVLGRVPSPARVSPADLRRVDARAAAIIDLRDWPRFRARHLAGSLWLPNHKSFTTNAGALVRPDEDIHLIADPTSPTNIDTLVRDLIHVGLDRIISWCSADELEADLTDADDAIEEISPEDGRDRHAAGSVDMLDVRGSAEVARGTYPGSTHAVHTRLPALLETLPKGRPLLIGCQSGRRSAVTAAYLKRLGRDAINLKGGFLAWAAAGMPVEH